MAAKADEATAAKTDAKVQLVEYSTKLVSDRTGIIDRLKIVLDEIDLEGGDTKAPRAYISAVSGLKVDASDYASTATRLKSWLESDEGGWRWARNIGLFLAYVIGGFLLAKVVRVLLRRSSLRTIRRRNCCATSWWTCRGALSRRWAFWRDFPLWKSIWPPSSP